VQVAKVDTFKRQVDFKLVSGKEEGKKQMKPDARSRRSDRDERWRGGKRTKAPSFLSRKSNRRRQF
jgi:hypothetical protein